MRTGTVFLTAPLHYRKAISYINNTNILFVWICEIGLNLVLLIERSRIFFVLFDVTKSEWRRG